MPNIHVYRISVLMVNETFCIKFSKKSSSTPKSVIEKPPLPAELDFSHIVDCSLDNVNFFADRAYI